MKCAACKTRDAEHKARCFPCIIGTAKDRAEQPWRRYQVDVPEGTSGTWSIRRFTVTETDEKFGRARALMSDHGRFVAAGTYTGLYRGGGGDGEPIMSDTRDEIRDHQYFMQMCEGRVLIAGLGLGMCLRGVLGNPKVEHVTVVEKSPDVIKLVAPVFVGSTRVEIVRADIFEWKPPKGARFDYGWFDIWDNICSDNLVEMTKLNRKFARSVLNKQHWCRSECLRYRRHDRRFEIAYGRTGT